LAQWLEFGGRMD